MADQSKDAKPQHAKKCISIESIEFGRAEEGMNHHFSKRKAVSFAPTRFTTKDTPKFGNEED
jgi:hypothetical protein